MSSAVPIEDVLNPVAVIRTTFETLAFFPDDEAMQSELIEMVSEARGTLAAQLQALCDTLQTEPSRFCEPRPFDFEAFKNKGLTILERGIHLRSIEPSMSLSLLNEGESDLYYFPSSGLLDLDAMRKLSGPQFAWLLFNDVLQGARLEANYVDRATFDLFVFRPYIVCMLLCYLSTDPRFPWSPGPDEKF